MTHLVHDFPQRLVKVITNAVSTFLLIAVFYILQYIFDMDFVCSCRPGIHLNGILYLAVPPVILSWVVHFMERFQRRRILSNWCSLCPNDFCSCLLHLLINYISLSAVWVATVLFDGDWFLCLMTNLNDSQIGIPCKVNLTFEEYRIKADHKTASLDIGFGVISCFFLVWSTVEIISACSIRKRTWKMGSVSTCEMLFSPYYREVYEDLLAEQVGSHLKNELTKIAMNRAEEICKPYLAAIGDHEQSFKDTCDGDDNVNNTVLEAWKSISSSDFYLK